MLTRLPGSKWWIETDDVTFNIIGEYNKAFINADIDAIQATLALSPDPSQSATDVAAILNIISKTDWTVVRKERTSNLVNAMYQAYQIEPRQIELAQLRAKLEALIALRDRLV